MATKNIQLPELGEGVTEGELVKWLVKPGDKIVADQAIAEMMTDKATVEVPSPASGIVRELKGKEGDVVEVGQVLITLDSEGDAAAAAPAAPAGASATKNPSGASAKAAPASTAGNASPSPSAAPALQAKKSETATTGTAPQGSRASSHAGGNGASQEIYPPVADTKVLATPSTRRLAREMGVDINVMKGSGLAGRVTRDDVTSGGTSAGGGASAGASSYQAPAMARPSYQGPAGAAEERVAIRGIRKKIAENMQMAKQIIPHITIADEANITQLVTMREELKAMSEKTGVKVTYLPFVMKAMIAAMREFPMFNASIDDAAQEIVYKKYFNLGFAADTPNGLVVPVIKNADQKTIAQLGKEIAELGKKARDGKLALDDMRGATTTITNIGSFGGTFATPIINHPEVAILGMYKIQDKPVVKKGVNGMEIDVIKSMNFTITADHRLIDGAIAVRFLQAFIARIENPGVLMLDMM
jgi:pyruvate dehydrogenase E2 component (dihydrolipoamide acetyltransferase)